MQVLGEVSEFADSIKDRNTSLRAILPLSPSDHTLHAKKKMFPHIAALHMKTSSQPLYLFTSCSPFELHSDKYAEVKSLIKEGNEGETSLLL